MLARDPYLSPMGGWGSGRQGGRPLADSSRKVDLAWLMRTGRVVDGCTGSGTIHWTHGGEPHGSISYRYNLTDAEDARLVLIYRQQQRGGEWKEREQKVRLSYTLPNLGGRRWWMHCPVRGNRVGKLYLPGGGDIFAGRRAWGLAYKSQRSGPRDRPFDRLFALQDQLNSPCGWEMPLRRPKGMWHRTFARHEARWWELDAQCAAAAAGMLGILRGF